MSRSWTYHHNIPHVSTLYFTMASQAFNISIPDSRIQDLKTRLSLASFPDELDEAGWDYGAPLQDIKRLTNHWLQSYDWKKTESKLNELPNRTASITVDGFGSLDLHFLHQPSTPDAVPLLFCHGWVCLQI